MLCISRRPNQSVMVGDIEVVVLRLNRGRVQLGITAPAVMHIDRKEKVYVSPPPAGPASSQDAD